MSLSAPAETFAAFADGARLLADVGGTNARFALETARGQFAAVQVLACADYPGLAEAVQAYLALPAVAAHGPVRHAAIAIANPIDGDQVRMTNHHWAFSIEALRQACGLATLCVVNDFTALARALPHLGADDKVQVGGGSPEPGQPIGLLGAGTGLGVSGLVPCGPHWSALKSEGGHVSFAPVNAEEVGLLQYAWTQYPHVSAERFLSGEGIGLIYRGLAAQRGMPDEGLAAPEISRRALDGSCALCADAIAVFCGMLGTVAGNLAVTLGAAGGVYIGGGIVPKLGDYFARSCFRARFEHKGRFGAYLARIPTFVITAEYPAFLGVSAILAEKLSTR
ncbi:glucokinase [Massilia sp. TS11]|uniref:glucokinase n=1 Tax=Massilia sp. TS11 TaxID=2908003 RepID=UPI001EDBD7F4|nr:glucokinase [Massilia sp. TS11]MCG2585910.1 glucokinase [Massilia sp. TS11]